MLVGVNIGVVFITTVVVAAVLVQPSTLTVAAYEPPFAVEAAAMEGFCKEEENDAGPVQEYVAPDTNCEVKFIGYVSQTGEFDEIVGAAGIGLTVATIDPAEDVQLLTSTLSK